jgi:hypothetical protein
VGFLDEAERGTKIWVDSKNKHPDPGRNFLWGYTADGEIVSDFKGTFRRAGKVVKVPYKESAATAFQEKEQRIKAIKNYLRRFR